MLAGRGGGASRFASAGLTTTLRMRCFNCLASPLGQPPEKLLAVRQAAFWASRKKVCDR